MKWPNVMRSRLRSDLLIHQQEKPVSITPLSTSVLRRLSARLGFRRDFIAWSLHFRLRPNLISAFCQGAKKGFVFLLPEVRSF